LWAVTRNEDGDASGFGSQLAWAPPQQPAQWHFPAKTDPERHDSPRLFRHGRDLYLISRRDPSGPFDDGFGFLPRTARRLALLASYSLRPKRTALFHVDTERHLLEPLADLCGVGDTAFPS